MTPKRTKVQYITVQNYYARYTCPGCKVEFQEAMDKRITRFLCTCGQEIIVDK